MNRVSNKWHRFLLLTLTKLDEIAMRYLKDHDLVNYRIEDLERTRLANRYISQLKLDIKGEAAFDE